jgi:ribosomal protein L34E
LPTRSRRVRKGIRRVFVRTPGGRTVVHYEDKNPGFKRCGICGEVLRREAEGLERASGGSSSGLQAAGP